MGFKQQKGTVLFLAMLLAVICCWETSPVSAVIYIGGIWIVWVRLLDAESFHSHYFGIWRATDRPQWFDVLTEIVLLLFWPLFSLVVFLLVLYAVIRG
jgi:hypothetical protein